MRDRPAGRPLASVRLEAPIPDAQKYLAIGMNYHDHAEEARKGGMAVPQHQLWFNKQVTCINGPYDPIYKPRVSEKMDYEAELGVVIGKRCRYVSVEDAPSVVGGYFVANDVTARDWQFKSPTFTLGKSFDSHGPIGPWITTADEVADPHNLLMRLWVNGELRQQANTGGMIHDIWQQIHELSQVMTLEPGDLIATGTCAGVGIVLGKFLQPGDVVKVEIEGLGHIENRGRSRATSGLNAMKRVLLRTLLLGLGPLLDRATRARPAFRAFAKRHDAVVQIQLKDGSIGRWFDVRAGRIRSHGGIHPKPGVRMLFKDVDTALAMMKPNPDMGEVVHAAKNFKVMVVGPDPLCVWWMQLLNLSQTSALRMGTPLPDGSTRYTMLTNGGPLFVHVKDGRIVRTVPIEFDAKDAPGWTIEARGRRFTPRRDGYRGDARAGHEVGSLFRQADPVPDEAGRLRSARRAQSAEPRQERLRAHQLGRGAGHRRQRNPAPASRARARGHDDRTRLAPPVGQRRLLPERAAALRQPGRLHAPVGQPRQLGGLVLGRDAPLGPEPARGHRRKLRPRGGLPARGRADGVLVERPGKHARRLRRA